jgi:hypothetical protein
MAETLARLRAPDGLVFHMSRCGSTLVSEILAEAPANRVVAEAEPIDSAIRLASSDPGIGQDGHVAAVRATVAALGDDPKRETRRYFVKLDCWHTLALPLLRAAFPATPWCFVYRDPVEVLVSHARRPGMHVVPGLLPPELFGFSPDEQAMPGPEYAARVLARIGEAVLEHWDVGGGLLVDYRELPDAVFTRILPHFGAEPDTAERQAMDAASRRDAKTPYESFVPDSEQKQREAGEAIRAAAAAHLAPIHARLEALRARHLQP